MVAERHSAESIKMSGVGRAKIEGEKKG